jgi:hypothetical protein
MLQPIYFVVGLLVIIALLISSLGRGIQGVFVLLQEIKNDVEKLKKGLSQIEVDLLDISNNLSSIEFSASEIEKTSRRDHPY